MAKLQVNCKSCSKTFDSPIQMDETSFETAQLSNNSYQCPHCGASNAYDKADHFFAE